MSTGLSRRSSNDVRGAGSLRDRSAAVPSDRRRIIDRVTFGYSAYEDELLQSMGLSQYVEYHLAAAGIPDDAVNEFLQINCPTLSQTPAVLGAYMANEPQNQLIMARLIRAIFSRRQLFERVVEFWTDHLNIDIRRSLTTFMKTADDRDVVRTHALGTFPNLLRASSRSPAMLVYLSNDSNRVGAPNENYPREIMELHAMGVNGGYTQTDVQQVARCFTGWTYQTTSAGPDAYKVRFNSANHDTGQKTVLGNVIPARSGASGAQDIDDVITILANHASTRRFISRKLCQGFWGYQPPTALVDSVESVYQSTNGDIKAMLRVILNDTTGGATSPKLKRPLHYLASMLRVLDARVTSTSSLVSALGEAGQVPFYWAPPNGYPDSIGAWANLLLPRWNFGARLMNNEWYNSTTQQGVFVDHVPMMAGAVTPAQVLDRIDLVIFQGRMPSGERSRLASYIGTTNPSSTRIREAIGLAVTMPSFQWY